MPVFLQLTQILALSLILPVTLSPPPLAARRRKTDEYPPESTN